MSWRDLIVTSQPHHAAPEGPTKGSFEDIEDFEPRYRKKNSLSLYDSSQESVQISKPLEASSISSKPIPSPSDPETPLQPGWFVVYRDAHGRLSGGPEDRVNGTVDACTWDGSTWMVLLTNGNRIRLGNVLAVSKTDLAGRVLAAWTVREHGYDGEGK
jgi:hypothetical protein